jgi:hypothetical protein
MAEIYNNRVCIFANELISLNIKRNVGSDKGFLSEGTFSTLRNRKQLLILRRSTPGSSALVDFETMRPDIKQKYIQVYGDPRAAIAAKTQKSALETAIVYGNAAYEYFSVKYRYDNDRKLPPEKVDEYTLNVRIMDALLKLRDTRKQWAFGGGNIRINIWERLCQLSNDLLPLKDPNGRAIFPHKLPQNWKSLKRKCEQYEQARAVSEEEGFRSVIHKAYGNKHAVKVLNNEQQAVMHKLISHHNNLNSVQIMNEYNKVADLMSWEPVNSPTTVDNYRKKMDLTTMPGCKGVATLRNTRMKQIHRSAPEQALTYWTLDGWTVELLYQKKIKTKEKDGKLYMKTTYTNRKTAVIVLDACKKYPIGYAIGDHESPALIREALRNAVNHTRELFGTRYKPLQLQSDNYQKKVMVPFYQAMTKYYTPAALGNAKSKIIEPYFLSLNRDFCQLQANWSGFGITADTANQPNLEIINYNRNLVPDEATVIGQIEAMIETERAKKIDDYREAWNHTEEARKIPFGTEEYLLLMGETTGRTNKLTGSGLYIEFMGKRLCFDSFDLSLRNYYNEDWIVRFDPDDMSQVLISNAKRLKSGRVEKETGTLRYLLQQEIKVPMALADQKPEHFEYRARVDVFNRELTAHVQEKGHDVDQHIGHLYQQVPGLLGNSLLDIHLITDSRGQHKDERSKARDNTAVDVEYEDVTEHVSRPDTLTGDDEDYDYNPLDMNFSR